MSLLDDLRNLLARHLAHVNSQTQQGTTRWIEDHLNRLDAVVSNDIAAGEAKVHEILGELYAATNAPDGAVPSTPAVPVEPAPAPSEPVTVAEPGPELPAPVPANPTTMGAPAAAPAPATDTTPAPAETAAPGADTGETTTPAA